MTPASALKVLILHTKITCYLSSKAAALARLTAHLEAETIDKRLNIPGRGRVLFHIMEHDRQHEGTDLLLERHPLIGEHYPGPPVHADYMMIVANKLLSLFAGANGYSLVRVDLVEGPGHGKILPRGRANHLNAG